ncbi:MAG: DUF1679 domain-containing protein [Candidatus Latescibacteria bacterium]|nr:DUF1679 domain-containing protein [Candidatus Latescibacterota bacterium]
MTQLITRAQEVTPDHLEGLLQKAHLLPQGSITGITVQGRDDIQNRHTGEVAQLRLTFRDRPPGAPQRLYFKIAQGGREVDFYNRLMPHLPDLPIPHCFEALYDPASQSAHLFLEDVSTTHAPNRFPPGEPPAQLGLDQLRQMAASFARLHAACWGHFEDGLWRPVTRPHLLPEHLDWLPFFPPVPQAIEHYFSKPKQDLTDFFDFLGPALSPARRTIWSAVFAAFPRLALDRLLGGRHLTLNHRDPKQGNILYQKLENSRDGTGDDEKVFLLDWQQARLWTGPEDLAAYLACYWPPEKRRQIEESVLLHYHYILLDCGVSQYDWAALWHDYRLGIAEQCYRWVRVRRTRTHITERICANIIGAFEDLHCDELL